MKSWLLTLVVVSLAGHLPAQERGIDIEAHIARLIQQGDEAENQGYYDLLLYYFDNPIDLNKTTGQELAQLGLLTRQQIADILAHIEATGKFMRIYELQALPSFTLADIKAIRPFITVSVDATLHKTLKGLFKGKTNYTTLGYSRLTQTALGYRNGAYLGSPDRMQLRFRLRNPGHASLGFSAQKDPGEPWLSNARIPRPDYLSAHAYLENQGRVKQLVVGDYRLQFGQGLVLGAGFMVGKNIETVATIKQATLGILPYTSITENRFFRGGGLAVTLTKGLTVTLFYSNQKLDATPADSAATVVSAIRTSGLHRTAAEVQAKDQLHEQVWGTAITLDLARFSTGMVIVNSLFDKTIVPPARDYNKFKFTGNKLVNYSWFGQYQAGSFLVFGEVAQTGKAGMGINLGLIGSISKFVSLSMLYRKFDPDFQSLYGLPFAERGTIGNESGFYWGIQLYPLRKLAIAAYYDMYRFPWLTATTAAPATGLDYMVRLSYALSEEANAFVQLRHESGRQRENRGPTFVNQPVTLLKSVINFDYNLEHPLTFRSRAQYNLSGGAEAGWLLYQDINYSHLKIGVTARILVFDTDSFNARQYAYEKDMLFTYTTRMFNGQGVSYYLIIKYKPLRHLALRCKWSYTEYAGHNEIGSGNDLLEGNRRTQITAQLHYVF